MPSATESRRINPDSIERPGNIIEVKRGDWSERLKWIEPQAVPSFAALEARRQATGQTLGFLRPTRIVKLEITPLKDSDWTDAEKTKLSQEGLFDSAAVKSRAVLRKLPFDFHYHYESGGKMERHKLVDWEVGALYWNCVRDYGKGRSWKIGIFGLARSRGHSRGHSRGQTITFHFSFFFDLLAGQVKFVVQALPTAQVQSLSKTCRILSRLRTLLPRQSHLRFIATPSAAPHPASRFPRHRMSGFTPCPESIRASRHFCFPCLPLGFASICVIRG